MARVAANGAAPIAGSRTAGFAFSSSIKGAGATTWIEIVPLPVGVSTSTSPSSLGASRQPLRPLAIT